jgi:hypothetical protein
VILSWNPSASADAKHAAAIGYCIYRETKPDNLAERINFFPLAGDRCVDDSVENGKKYHYVVRAVSAKGVVSTASKPAPVSIPNHSHDAAEVLAGSVPLCREPLK